MKAALVTLLALSLASPALAGPCDARGGAPVTVFAEVHGAPLARASWLVVYNPNDHPIEVAYRHPSVNDRTPRWPESCWVLDTIGPNDRLSVDVTPDEAAGVVEVFVIAGHQAVISITSWQVVDGAYVSPFAVPASTVCRQPHQFVK